MLETFFLIVDILFAIFFGIVGLLNSLVLILGIWKFALYTKEVVEDIADEFEYDKLKYSLITLAAASSLIGGLALGIRSDLIQSFPDEVIITLNILYPFAVVLGTIYFVKLVTLFFDMLSRWMLNAFICLMCILSVYIFSNLIGFEDNMTASIAAGALATCAVSISLILLVLICFLIYEGIKFLCNKIKENKDNIISFLACTGIFVLLTVITFWADIDMLTFFYFLFVGIIAFSFSLKTEDYISNKLDIKGNMHALVLIPTILLFSLPVIGLYCIFDDVNTSSDTNSAEVYEQPANAYNQVYITEHGSKYHWYRGCRGLNAAIYVDRVSLKQAKALGYTECSICGK